MKRQLSKVFIPTITFCFIAILLQWIAFITIRKPEPQTKKTEIIKEFVLINNGMLIKEIIVIGAMLLTTIYFLNREDKTTIAKKLFSSTIGFITITCFSLLCFGLKYSCL